MPATVHDFSDCLKASHEYQKEDWWETVYKKAFPGYLSMCCVEEDGWAQRGGVDRVIVTKGGKTVAIDEKVRSKDYGDILLERWSDRDRKKPGWVQKDLFCDYIAYAFAPSRRCYLLPVIPLQRAWKKYGREWIARYGVKGAANKGYVTESVPVPIPVLYEAITEMLVIIW